MALVGLGILAGVVTTVAGMGGGVMLLLALGAWWDDPLRALAVATPALLVGNVHRCWMFRGSLPSIAWRFAGAALVGAGVGGALALALPGWVIQGALVLSTFAAVLQHLRPRAARVPAGWLAPAGGLIGFASTAGGAGLLAGPTLLAAGLSGGAYLATSSLGAVSMHVGRLLALGGGGRMTGDVWADAALLAAAIPVGTALGGRVRTWISDAALGRVELATCAGLVGLAVVGAL